MVFDSEGHIDLDRRRLMQGATAIAGLGMAGCLGGDDDPGGDGDTGTQEDDGGDSTTTDSNGGGSEDSPTLNVATIAEMTSLDPTKQTLSVTNEWIYGHFNALLQYTYDAETDSYEVVPDLAESYELTEEGDEYVAQFVLRDDVEYHNGEPLTADLVKTEIDYWEESGSSQYLNFADRVSVDNESTVNIHMPEQVATFEYSIAGRLIANPYLREERGDGEFSSNIEGGGTGPYRLVEYQAGSELHLEKYDNYHEEGRPGFDEMSVYIIPEASTRVARLETGEIHLDNYGVRPVDWQQFENHDTINANQGPSGLTAGVVWNLENEAAEPLRDKRVRRALSLATDREAFINAVYQGVGVPQSLPVYPEYDWDFPEVHDPNPYDPEEAQRLLDEAGYGDGFEIPALCVSSGYYRRMGSAVKDLWGDVGVDVQLNLQEVSTMWSNIYQANYAVGISQLGPTPDPDQMARMYIVSADQGGYNFIRGWEHEEYFDLVDEAYHLTDQEARKDLYRQAFEIWNDEMPYLHFSRERNLSLIHQNVKGYWAHPTGTNSEAIRDVYWEA